MDRSKSLPNPYNPSGKTSKERVSKKMHVTPAPVNRFSENTLEDHERAHTGKAGSTVRHGQDAIGRPGADPIYQRLRASLDKGLDN